MSKLQWWEEGYGFFGEFYMHGDNSAEGHLSAKALSLMERTRREVDGVMNLLQPASGGRILDLPCGYGRHSIGLAKAGFRVVGSDINSVHLGKASAEARAQGLSIDFRKENMLEIKYVNEFDAVINMFYSFGFFETDAENLEVLRRIYASLKFDGKFLMHTDVSIPRIMAGKYKEDEIRTMASGDTLRIVDKFNPITKRIEGAWIINELNGESVRRDYSVRVYEKNEFIDMCLQVGFVSCVAYGDWSGKEYSEDDEEVMFVATK